MKFSSDELMPFFEVRTGMSKLLVDVQTGKEIVITRHGKPIGALVAASELYRYRELERVITELTTLLNATTTSARPDNAQKAFLELACEAGKLLKKPGESKP